VSRQDHFFELGGHSLMAIQLGARLRESLGVALPLREVFAHPTLAALAEAIVQYSAEPARRPRWCPSSRAPTATSRCRCRGRNSAVGPRSPRPRGERRVPRASALRLTGRLDVAALQATLDRVVQRHEVLRTRFAEIAGQPAQCVDDGLALELVRHDLGALGGHEQEAAVERFAFDHATEPFDLATGPLLRAALLRLADDEHVLLVTQHHIVSDGWSIGVLVREVAALYAAFAAGDADPLPRWPSNTPTTRPGSGRGCRASACGRSSTSGPRTCAARRRC
jgi:aryl carrier-like protein